MGDGKIPALCLSNEPRQLTFLRVMFSITFVLYKYLKHNAMSTRPVFTLWRSLLWWWSLLLVWTTGYISLDSFLTWELITFMPADQPAQCGW